MPQVNEFSWLSTSIKSLIFCLLLLVLFNFYFSFAHSCKLKANLFFFDLLN